MTSEYVDKMIDELKAAGWTPQTSTIWKSPNGQLFIGPAGAWKRMQAWHELLDRGEVVTVRTFRSGSALGVGKSRNSFFVFDRNPGSDPMWRMHCGPYSTLSQGCEWAKAIRDIG